MADVVGRAGLETQLLGVGDEPALRRLRTFQIARELQRRERVELVVAALRLAERPVRRRGQVVGIALEGDLRLQQRLRVEEDAAAHNRVELLRKAPRGGGRQRSDGGDRRLPPLARRERRRVEQDEDLRELRARGIVARLLRGDALALGRGAARAADRRQQTRHPDLGGAAPRGGDEDHVAAQRVAPGLQPLEKLELDGGLQRRVRARRPVRDQGRGVVVDGDDERGVRAAGRLQDADQVARAHVAPHGLRFERGTLPKPLEHGRLGDDADDVGRQQRETHLAQVFGGDLVETVRMRVDDGLEAMLRVRRRVDAVGAGNGFREVQHGDLVVEAQRGAQARVGDGEQFADGAALGRDDGLGVVGLQRPDRQRGEGVRLADAQRPVASLRQSGGEFDVLVEALEAGVAIGLFDDRRGAVKPLLARCARAAVQDLADARLNRLGQEGGLHRGAVGDAGGAARPFVRPRFEDGREKRGRCDQRRQKQRRPGNLLPLASHVVREFQNRSWLNRSRRRWR